MAGKRKVWCVAWWPYDWPRKAKTQEARLWCATFRGHEPNASQDRTSCGQVVTAAVGAEKRYPTCQICRRAVDRRRR